MKMFRKMGNEFDHSAFRAAVQRNKIKHGQMLNKFAETYAASVWTYWDTIFVSHKDDRKHLVYPTDTASIDLAELNCAGHEKLLENDTILALFTGCNTDSVWRQCFRNLEVSKNIIRTCRLFYPQRLEINQSLHMFDCFINAPFLVGVNHQEMIADFFANNL